MATTQKHPTRRTCPPLLLLVGALLGAPAVAQDAVVQASAQKGPKLGSEYAAVAGDQTLTYGELDELLLLRHGVSPDGRAALRQLLELKLIDHLGQVDGVSISAKELSRRWSAIDREVRGTGLERGLEQYLEQEEVDAETFREVLRKGLLHEKLTRRALKLGPNEPLGAEQQNLWLTSVLTARPYQEYPHPWRTGIVATSGELQISCSEFAEHLRAMLANDALIDACYQLLLIKHLERRMPDLAESALDEAIEQEVDRRRREAEADPRFQGAKYEQLLRAKGLSIEGVRRDASTRVAALAHLWIDRTHDDRSLRATYEAERELFDGLYGEGLELYVLTLKAARFKNDLNPRTFEEAEAELETLRGQMQGTADFKRLAALHSEDPSTREGGGRMGVITRGAVTIPSPLRTAAFEVLEQAGEEHRDDLAGTIVGPVRIQGSVALLCLGTRRPAPSWDTMARYVHREMRRRFLEEVLPRASLATWLDMH